MDWYTTICASAAVVLSPSTGTVSAVPCWGEVGFGGGADAVGVAFELESGVAEEFAFLLPTTPPVTAAAITTITTTTMMTQKQRRFSPQSFLFGGGPPIVVR